MYAEPLKPRQAASLTHDLGAGGERSLALGRGAVRWGLRLLLRLTRRLVGLVTAYRTARSGTQHAMAGNMAGDAAHSSALEAASRLCRSESAKHKGDDAGSDY